MLTSKTDEPILKRQTVTQEVTDILRQRIIRSVYKGGDQIRQEALASELGVSRIPVREALLQLETEGLLNIHTHKGAVVSPLTLADAREIFDARTLFEPFILKESIARRTDEDVKRLESALLDYENVLRSTGNPEDLSRLNWVFHVRLCAAAQRPRSMAILTSLHNSADRYLRLQIDSEAAQRSALIDHRKIFEAYAEGSVRAACKLLRDHILAAQHEVLERLADGPSPFQV